MLLTSGVLSRCVAKVDIAALGKKGDFGFVHFMENALTTNIVSYEFHKYSLQATINSSSIYAHEDQEAIYSVESSFPYIGYKNPLEVMIPDQASTTVLVSPSIALLFSPEQNVRQELENSIDCLEDRPFFLYQVLVWYCKLYGIACKECIYDDIGELTFKTGEMYEEFIDGNKEIFAEWVLSTKLSILERI